MYQVDDVVVYGLHGVCRITQIEPKVFAGEEQLYYTMKPVFDDRSTFFIPAGNELSDKKLRPLLTPGEIKELIRSIPTQKTIGITDEKHRKETYRQIIESGDRCEIMRLVKTLHKRRKDQQKAGKKQHLTDERFLKEAETVLGDEFAYVLQLDRAEIASYIKEQLGE
ncbi:MAG: CarD family transcriptional regulator [Clostridia bacterium]